MKDLRGRVTRLEERRRRRVPVGHFLPVARYPWGVADGDQARWLRTLRCPCGRQGCPELRVGLLLPDKAPSPEAWAEAYTERARRDREGGGRGQAG